MFADGRRAKELKNILQIAFLYGCFNREDIANLLDINKNTLNREYGILNEIYGKEKYYIPDKRNKEMVLDYDRIRQRVNDLWEIYAKEEGTVLAYKRLLQYKSIVHEIKKGRPVGFSYLINQWCQYVEDANLGKHFEGMGRTEKYMMQKIWKEMESAWEKGEESENLNSPQSKSLRNLLSDLVEGGAVKVEKRKYISAYPPLILSANEYKQIKTFLQYAVNVIFPALPGYYLMHAMEKNNKVCRDALPVHRKDKKDIFVFPDYQPQSVLDEETYLELELYRREGSTVCFSYRDNSENILEINERAKKQEKNIIPYCFLHEIRYGRTFLVGYCLENGYMMGYQLDRISDIKKSKKKGTMEKEELERLYQDTFFGSWIGGRIDKENGEMKKVCIEILNPERNRTKVEREGISCNRQGKTVEREGKCFYEITVPNTRDMKPWIMRLGSKVRIDSVKGVLTGKDYTAEEGELCCDVRNTWEEMKKLYEED